MTTNSLPSPRILMGPGPSSVTPRVLEALARAPIGYLDPELFSMLNGLRSNLRTVYGTANEWTFPLTGTGMAGMESCLSNLLEPGDKAVIGVIGFFGARMVELARRLGAEVTVVEGEWGGVLDPDEMAKAIQQSGKLKLVGCVHAETSTGVNQPLKHIASLAHEHGALFLADAVTSLGGISVDIDNNGVDVAYSGTQKCVGAPPGLSPITVSESALQVVKNRKFRQSHWFFDWNLLQNYYDAPHMYHHTVPVNMLFALNEALLEIVDEGLDERFKRHRDVSAFLLSGLEELGIYPFVKAEHRLPTLNTVIIPDHIVDEAAVRARLLQEFGVEIGGGLGALKGKIWRIGTMGASATLRNVLTLLGALKRVLSE